MQRAKVRGTTSVYKRLTALAFTGCKKTVLADNGRKPLQPTCGGVRCKALGMYSRRLFFVRLAPTAVSLKRIKHSYLFSVIAFMPL